jgi:Leucine Rich repeat
VEGVRALQPALYANHTLKELTLSCCRLGDEGIRLIADALAGNSTINKLHICGNGIASVGLDDITRILEMTQLKSIDFGVNTGMFNNESSTRRLGRVLSRHEFLRELRIAFCQLGDGGVRIIADALVGNTTMEALYIWSNGITSAGLADVERLLDSTQLKSIALWGRGRDVVQDEDATQHFVTTLQQKKSILQELPRIDSRNLPINITAAMYASMKNSLTRNQQLEPRPFTLGSASNTTTTPTASAASKTSETLGP